jgi:hypothetical protein
MESAPLWCQNNNLKGHLQEEVFMQQPQGNEKLGFISLACKLNHALYGFK